MIDNRPESPRTGPWLEGDRELRTALLRKLVAMDYLGASRPLG